MEITELQKDLAATFRWAARLNMHEGVANHFSACLPNSTTDFYVNKSGIHFSRMKASDLILVTKENFNDLKTKPEIVDSTAINIHGTIHHKVPHTRCIFHVHSKKTEKTMFFFAIFLIVFETKKEKTMCFSLFLNLIKHKYKLNCFFLLLH